MVQLINKIDICCAENIKQYKHFVGRMSAKAIKKNKKNDIKGEIEDLVSTKETQKITGTLPYGANFIEVHGELLKVTGAYTNSLYDLTTGSSVNFSYDGTRYNDISPNVAAYFHFPTLIITKRYCEKCNLLMRHSPAINIGNLNTVVNYAVSNDENIFTVCYHNIQTYIYTLDTYNIEKVNNPKLISKINFGDYININQISNSNQYILCSGQSMCRIFDMHTNTLISTLSIDTKNIVTSCNFLETYIYRYAMSYDSQYVATVYNTCNTINRDKLTNRVNVWDIYGNIHANFKYKYNTTDFILDTSPNPKCEFSPNNYSLLACYLNGNTIMLYDVHYKCPINMIKLESNLLDFSFGNNNMITVLSQQNYITTQHIKKGLKSQQKHYIDITNKRKYIKVAMVPFRAYGFRANLMLLIIKGKRDRRHKLSHLPSELWNWIVDEFFQNNWKLAP